MKILRLLYYWVIEPSWPYWNNSIFEICKQNRNIEITEILDDTIEDIEEHLEKKFKSIESLIYYAKHSMLKVK